MRIQLAYVVAVVWLVFSIVAIVSLWKAGRVFREKSEQLKRENEKLKALIR